MKIELAPPGSMPGLQDLYTLTESRGIEVVMSLYESVDAGCDITDVETGGDDANMLGHLKALEETFYPYNRGEEALLTTFRATAFARVLSQRLLRRDSLQGDYGHIPHELDGEDFDAFAFSQSRAYLEARPKIDIIIGDFLHLISPDPVYAPNARLIAAFQLIAIDRYEQQVYSQRQLKDFAQEIDAWEDGILPDDLEL